MDMNFILASIGVFLVTILVGDAGTRDRTDATGDYARRLLCSAK